MWPNCKMKYYTNSGTLIDYTPFPTPQLMILSISEMSLNGVDILMV